MPSFPEGFHHGCQVRDSADGHVLARWVARVRKSGGKPLESHRAVLIKGIQPATDHAERLADDLLGSLQEELAPNGFSVIGG